MRQIVLTQVKIVLTLPNLVYKGNETNSVNKPFYYKRKKDFFIFLLNKKDLLTLFVSLPL